MSSVKIKIFDENDNLLKEKVVESSSKYSLKKIGKNLVEKTEGGSSYSCEDITKDK